MRIQIRHQINDTYEEIYFFDIISKSINYNGIYFSARNDVNDIWGYDWKEYYKSQEKFEIQKLRELANLDEYDSNDMLLESNYSNEYNIIYKKYNPILNKTNNGTTYLTGLFSNNIWKQCPPKIFKEHLKELIQKEINKVLDSEFNKIEYE